MVNYDLSNNYFMPSFTAWNTQGSKYSQKYIQYVSKYVIWPVDADRILERAALACLDAEGLGMGMGEDGSTISVQLDYQCCSITQIKQITSISLGCWLQKQWVLSSLQYFTQKFMKQISFPQM